MASTSLRNCKISHCSSCRSSRRSKRNTILKMKKNEKNQKPKFYAETEYIDVDTGEVIDKATYERENYYTIKINKNYERTESYIKAKYQRECKRSTQTTIKFD